MQPKKIVKVDKKNVELEDFRKKHSESFLYFLEEYEKWVELQARAKK